MSSLKLGNSEAVTLLVDWLKPSPQFVQLVEDFVKLIQDLSANQHLLVEVSLVIFILVLLFQKSYKKEKTIEELSPKEVNELIREWQPAPLIPVVTEQDRLNAQTPVVTSVSGNKMVVNGKTVTNFVTNDYLGFSSHADVKKRSTAALRKYGCGTCGPRGFYGTIDVHLELEKRLAGFMGTSDAIIYASGFSTIASAIPSFLKKGDLLVCDEAISFATSIGAELSRCQIRYFKHNDMEDLERILREVVASDRAQRKKLNRRFIVGEGLYYNTGNIIPLDKVVSLKNTYRFRLILEESHSFGALGKHGRGVTEHFNIPITEVDVLCATMGATLSAIGGFCVGSRAVVDHQRLNGSGYCFSASLPALVCSAALQCLDFLEKDASHVQKLAKNKAVFHAELAKVFKGTSTLIPYGSKDSHVVHFYLRKPTGVRPQDEQTLRTIVDEALNGPEALGITMSRYNEVFERHLPAPSIRVNLNATHSEADLKKVAAFLASK
eukprot:TRINITY_DN1214_c0_g1_i2.p1 TRINITY_DN1214_c0_g1~~TRINITY_DN1214_c0_g1_i2.p1  ORF type:complete len:494 (-),score=128.29 TRINITY_DN1214_c0_g1_i2:414-1895(-)